LDKTDGQLDNLEQLVQNIEFAQIEVQVVQGLKEGNEALQALHKIVSLEDVEQVLADTEEAVEYQREIDELLSGGFTQEDEDAVLQELDEIINEQLPQVPQAAEEDVLAKLPEVPTEEPVETEPAKVKAKQEPLLA
jgi:charged multivesicular body protein 6